MITRPITRQGFLAHELTQGKQAVTVLSPLRTGYLQDNSQATVAEVLAVTRHPNQIPLHVTALGLRLVEVSKWLENGVEVLPDSLSGRISQSPICYSESTLNALDTQKLLDMETEYLGDESRVRSVRKIRK